MKLRFKIFVSMLCFSVAVPAVADMAQVKMTQGPGVGNGGAFNAEVISGAISYDSLYLGPGSKFPTFCVELVEYFTPGATYYADSRTEAYQGGAGGPSPDPLDPVTAALYQQYLGLNTLDVDTGTEYQLAIWKVEQEIEWDNNQWEKYNSDTPIHSDYQQAKFDNTVIDSLINSVGTPTTIGDVRVMTLWDTYSYDAVTGIETFSGNHQDQLVFVPLPGAVLMALFGLGAAGVKLRKYA